MSSAYAQDTDVPWLLACLLPLVHICETVPHVVWTSKTAETSFTSIDCALGRLRPLTSSVIVLAMDNHNILVVSDDDQLASFAKTRVSDAFNGASSSPGRAVGELAGKAIGSRRHETRRDEARLPRLWGVHQQALERGAHPWGPCCDMFNTWRQANDDTYPKSPIGKVDGDLLSHSANAAARLRVQSTLAGLNLS